MKHIISLINDELVFRALFKQEYVFYLIILANVSKCICQQIVLSTLTTYKSYIHKENTPAIKTLTFLVPNKLDGKCFLACHGTNCQTRLVVVLTSLTFVHRSIVWGAFIKTNFVSYKIPKLKLRFNWWYARFAMHTCVFQDRYSQFALHL